MLRKVVFEQEIISWKILFVAVTYCSATSIYHEPIISEDTYIATTLLHCIGSSVWCHLNGLFLSTIKSCGSAILYLAVCLEDNPWAQIRRLLWVSEHYGQLFSIVLSIIIFIVSLLCVVSGYCGQLNINRLDL